MYSIEALSAGEIIRSISRLTGKEIDSVESLTRANSLDEIAWQLITIAFDMPPVPYKRMYLIKFLNKLVEDLQFPYPFRISDFGEERDRRKWLSFFSCLIPFLESQSKFQLGVQLLVETRAARSNYAKLLEVIAKKEKQLAAWNVERRTKQSTIDQLTRRMDEMTTRTREFQKSSAEAESRLNSMRSENTSAAKQSEALRDEIKSLKDDFEACSKRLLHDIESLPKSISELHERLHSVETEMHRAFEIRSSTMDQITGFNRFESLLDQLKDVLSETEDWMKKYISIHRTEKEKLIEMEQIKRKFDEAHFEKNELTQTAMNLQSQLMRSKLLLANKKKAIQANKKSAMREIDSINSDAQDIQRRIRLLEQQHAVYEDQLRLEREGIVEISQRMKQADKLGRLLSELRKEFLSSK